QGAVGPAGGASGLLALLDAFDVPDTHGFEFNQLKSRLIAGHADDRTVAGLRDLLIDLLRTEDTQAVRNTLADLLDWLLLPEDFESRMEEIKLGLEANTLKYPVRDTAAFINDLQAFLRHDVRELAEYLKRVSQQLHEVEGELAGALGENRLSVENSGALLDEVNAEIGALQAAAAPGSTHEELKLAVDQRVGRVRTVLSTFIDQQEQRHATYARQIEFLTREMRAFEHEADTIRQSLEAEHRKAYLDALTGVPNRLALEERMKLEFEKVRRYNHGLIIAVIDIDHFKKVNDNFGHKAGDKVLSYIASMCNKRLRASDFFARYGGEEFVALFPETSMENAHALCEQLRQKVEDTNVGYRRKRVPVTVSLGLYKVDRNDTPDRAFERADRALYKAKQAGRNRVVVA
ncbi:MAG: GGDEF domain-containing protein, partial [Gammaproteobacteria bacterium]|nr:GGDEF domain-containing protein [Gammaproteobacteria bacterium]